MRSQVSVNACSSVVESNRCAFKDLRPIAAIEAFDKRVLIGLAGLDVVDGHVLLGRPVDKDLSQKLRTIVRGKRAFLEGFAGHRDRVRARRAVIIPESAL
jgi:hypothetical protein